MDSISTAVCHNCIQQTTNANAAATSSFSQGNTAAPLPCSTQHVSDLFPQFKFGTAGGSGDPDPGDDSDSNDDSNGSQPPRQPPRLTKRPKTPDGRIAPRSGLAAKHFIDTGAGVIDADYRGPVKVLLFNHADADYAVQEGDRVAQLIIERIYTPEVVEVQELEESVRGAGGFGSTGTN